MVLIFAVEGMALFLELETQKQPCNLINFKIFVYFCCWNFAKIPNSEGATGGVL